MNALIFSIYRYLCLSILILSFSGPVEAAGSSFFKLLTHHRSFWDYGSSRFCTDSKIGVKPLGNPFIRFPLMPIMEPEGAFITTTPSKNLDHILSLSGRYGLRLMVDF